MIRDKCGIVKLQIKIENLNTMLESYNMQRLCLQLKRHGCKSYYLFVLTLLTHFDQKQNIKLKKSLCL